MKLFLHFLVTSLLAAWILFAQECEAKLFSARLMAVSEETAPTVQLDNPPENSTVADDLGCDAAQCVQNDLTVEGQCQDPIRIPDAGSVTED